MPHGLTRAGLHPLTPDALASGASRMVQKLLGGWPSPFRHAPALALVKAAIDQAGNTRGLAADK